MKLVTIIMPFYKKRSYIYRSIKSAINQTYKKIEIIIIYDDTDILLDTGSTCSVFKNINMLIGVKRSMSTMRALSNGGHQDSTQMGTSPGFFDVWYNNKSLLNILSMKDVRKKFRVTMDTDIEPTINVHLGEKKVDEVITFTKNENLVNNILNK